MYGPLIGAKRALNINSAGYLRHINILLLLLLSIFDGTVTRVYLSEHEASETFVHLGVTVDELEEIHATAVFLHHHLYKLLVLKHVNHLVQDIENKTKHNQIALV